MNEGKLLETQIYCIAALMFSFFFKKKKAKCFKNCNPFIQAKGILGEKDDTVNNLHHSYPLQLGMYVYFT